MEESDVDAALADAEAAFDAPAGDVETGLAVDGAALLQLRKACRLLAAAGRLRAADGYHTLVIEASFAATERTIQSYLLDADVLSPDAFVGHTDVYERGRDAGLYDDAFADRLIRLWEENRSHAYYREGKASRRRADAMYRLADEMHAHVLHLAGMDHECVCP